MQEISDELLLKLLPSIQPVELNIWVDILNAIECPNDFRSLKLVIHTLEHCWRHHKANFIETFAFNISQEQVQEIELFKPFSFVNLKAFKMYEVEQMASGSMSERPIYAFLHAFPYCESVTIFKVILHTLNHYYQNENVINERDKQEQVFRAFRLSLNMPEFNIEWLNDDNIWNIAHNLEDAKESELFSDKDKNRVLGYIREMIHFYKTDWARRFLRNTKKEAYFRNNYEKKKFDKIIGSDELYTHQIKSIKQPLEDAAAGLERSEDFPAISFVKTQAVDNIKADHEKPDISLVRDDIKIKAKHAAIKNQTQKSHNISLLNTNVLQGYELSYLTDELKSTTDGTIKNIEKTLLRVIITLCLLFGREVKDITKIRISNNPNNPNKHNETLYHTNEGWYLKGIHKWTTFRTKTSENTNLLKVGTEVNIPLPEWFNHHFSQTLLKLIGKSLGSSNQSIYEDPINQILKQVNTKNHCQISLKKIRYHIVNYIGAKETFDPVILESLTGTASYYTRSARHYAWYSNPKIEYKITEMWEQMFQQFFEEHSQLKVSLNPDFPDENEIGFGSQFTPRLSSLQQLVIKLKDGISAFSAFEAGYNLNQLIQYHNSYTLYSLYFLLNATGYRAVANPLPAFSLNLARYNALCISDKDDNVTFAHMRVIACATELKEQLNYYFSHVRSLSRLLSVTAPNRTHEMNKHTSALQFVNASGTDKLEWFLQAKNSKIQDGLFVFFEKTQNDKLKSTNAYPSSVKNKSSDLVDLPMNFGRHYLRFFLQHNDISHELIKFQMGHWVTGENPFELFSSQNFTASINTLLPVLDSMLSEIGWTAIPSAITRKRL